MTHRIQRTLLHLLGDVTPRQVLEVQVKEGAGIDGNCIRPVKYFLDAHSGEVLARVDLEPNETAKATISMDAIPDDCELHGERDQLPRFPD